MRSALLAVFSLLALAACDSTQSLQELRLATPPDDAYQAALASGYQGLAEAKAHHYEWSDSEYFADKGLVAAHGGAIQPEETKNWSVAPAATPEFNDARTRLIAAIDANKTTQPALTAQAVVAYDRWLVTAHNEPSLAAITESHDTFFTALAKLEAVHVVQPGMNAPSSEPVNSSTQKTDAAPTVIYFPFDSDKLGAGAKTALENLAKMILGAGKANVSINGHTDRAGTEQYNMDLSQRRAKFVLHSLAEAGAPIQELHYFAFGESDPAIPTADGVREPRNRRVEVVIEK